MDMPGSGTSSPVPSTSQGAQAEDPICPICWGTIIDEASVSWCRHTFCFSCILDWSRIRAMCPVCQGPLFFLDRKVGNNDYEQYRMVQYTSSAIRAQAERARSRFDEGMQQHPSSGIQHHASSSSGHGSSDAGALERSQSRSLSQHLTWRSMWQGHHYNPSLSSTSTHPQHRAQEATRDQAPAPRPERDVPTSSARSRHHQRGHRVSSQNEQATRSRSRQRSHSAQHQRRWEQQRERSNRHVDRPLRQARHVQASSRRSRGHQRGHRVSFRDEQPTRSPSRRSSLSTRRQTQAGQQSRRDPEDRQALSPEQQVPAQSRGRQRRQRRSPISSSERQAARSRSRQRSRSPARRRAQ